MTGGGGRQKRPKRMGKGLKGMFIALFFKASSFKPKLDR